MDKITENKNKTDSLLPAILALVALSVIWGYNWVVMKKCLNYANPFDFVALRGVIGSASLFLLMLWKRKPFRPKAITETITLGLLSTTGCVGLVTWALAIGAVGKTAIIVYFMPFWVLMLAWPILGERIYGPQWFAVILAFAGLVIILEPWQLQGALQGRILAVLSGIAWAGSAIYIKIINRKTGLDLISMTAWQMLFGSIPLIVVAMLIASKPIEWSAYFTIGLIYSSVISQSVALLLWFYVLNKLPAGVASMGTLATPVIGIIGASIELGERPTFMEAGGMALIVAGLTILSLYGITIYRRINTRSSNIV